ncbi:MAG: hypothetical protein GF372_14670 [Candidatus Marinimicrobia bacterium]|nr:hypothetical protein [Candidatus Neomarinimicrobiota bacterium]
MKKIVALLTSVKLAVVLILLLAVLAVASTFFPESYFSETGERSAFLLSPLFLYPYLCSW